ncbi:MAG: hypothetical protein JRM85_03135 [Nitrososphaerota archaeon]|jgi:hypothetical protein|nr:hypothetical protein [Nitrososphaerota archaeon]MDG6919309.1 hypothetical protein [Nitrososphaerota archaeon]
MTICIAARCETDGGAPKIVFCADRMISAGLQFEHGEAKIQWLNPTSLVLVSSNDSLSSDMIVKNVQAKTGGSSMTTRQIVQIFKEECSKFKQARMERDILVPLGFTYESFWKRSTELPKDAIDHILGQLENYDYAFQTQFVVIGIDQESQGAYASHIYIVDENGKDALQDYLGFGVIGSGSGTAYPDLTKLKWHRNISMTDSLVRIYSAKKAAERMGGVGTETDLYVLHVFEGTDKTRRVGLWEATTEVRRLLQSGIDANKQKETEIYTDILVKVQSIFVRPQTAQQTTTSGSSTIQT